MANKSIERGKVIEKLFKGTFFDVRQVPKYNVDGKTGKKTMESSSLCLFVGKHNVKYGFKNLEEISNFLKDNLTKYNKKTKSFS